MGRPTMGAGTSGGTRILLVEDDAVSLKLMRDVLTVHGYETLEATTGLDALARVREAAVSLIVMDVGLPDLDGVEVTRRLKVAPETQSIPVIAVTAYAMPEEEQRVRAAGSDHYMAKPLRFADFVNVVRGMLDEG